MVKTGKDPRIFENGQSLWNGLGVIVAREIGLVVVSAGERGA